MKYKRSVLNKDIIQKLKGLDSSQLNAFLYNITFSAFHIIHLKRRKKIRKKPEKEERESVLACSSRAVTIFCSISEIRFGGEVWGGETSEEKNKHSFF